MEFVSLIITPIIDSLMVPLKRQMGYLFSSTTHVRNMTTKMTQLEGKRIDVQNHVKANDISNLEVPARVPDWLKEAENIKNDVQSISGIEGGCFDFKLRYRVGRKSVKNTEVIENLIEESLEMHWSDAQKPLGKVNTSAPSSGDGQNYFKSREKSFNESLGFLQQDHTCQVVALCGMGGVGKTIMMEQLKKTAENKKVFDWIVKVVIGREVNMYSVQQSVADYMNQHLTQMSVAARADRLRITFGKVLENKEKVLVILDDLWETIELKDIGLSPLPNGFKLLLTSRSQSICEQIAEESNLDLKVVRVEVMEELEAHNFFWKIIGALKQYDKELNKLGSDIVRRCGYLPLAIKLIATTLKVRENYVWRDTLTRLKKNDLDNNVQEIIEISYKYIQKEEEKAIFLLCGLYPDDFDIPVEELTRYAWGLQLLNEVSSLGDARDRTKTCLQNLKSANLLINSDYVECVKMHDLVLAFVLGKVSKADYPWMVNHGNFSNWTSITARVSESCKRISMTCMGMSEFPRDFKYPNLSLLRLTHGDKLLKFPKDFYEKMKNLEVIAYEKMQYPFLPRSLECSTKLRTLILHRCVLLFDCFVIGELLNLEVLSFAHCGIRKLPSTIGKLKQLKLLDLTGCVNLRIDGGVLKNLVKLEELYMKVVDEKAIPFTDGNRDELAECSEHLSALEVEFFGNNHKLPENILFTKLERFRISIGCSLGENTGLTMHSFKNTLMLVTNKDELLECKVNELFEKTDVLYLEVIGMNDLEEVLVESIPFPQQSFNNLKVLHVFKCENLTYLFTVPMANGLMNLEWLTVSQCPVLSVLAHSMNAGAGAINFQELKFLYLDDLPKFVGLCNIVNVIELPQLVELRLDGLPNFTSIYQGNSSATSSMCSNVSTIQPFFNKEVLIPKLEILRITRMDKLKEIWPCQVSSSDKVDACMLREIGVYQCDNIVNLFPTNPMSLLGCLEELQVSECGSIEVLFNIDMSCGGEIEEYNSNLRRICVVSLGKLRELWRMKGESSSNILIRSFQAVERIQISNCVRLVNVFPPTITNSNMKALMCVSIDGRRPWAESRRNIELVRKSQEINVISKVEITEVYGDIVDTGFLIHPKPVLNHLEDLSVNTCKDVEVVFEIESSSRSSSSRDLTTTPHNHQPLLLPYLKRLILSDMERMVHVWKYNWNKLLIPHNESKSSFHNLTTIYLLRCHSIKYLFSPLMIKILSNLKEVEITCCDGIEEVVSNRYDENDAMHTSIFTHQTNTISFPHLESLCLQELPRLNSIDGELPHLNSIDGGARGRSRSSTITNTSIHNQFKFSEVGVVWFLCQYSKKIDIYGCHALSRVFPSYVVGQLHKLEELKISKCKSMVELFDIEGANNDGVDGTNNVGYGSDDTCTTMTVPTSTNMTLVELPNLTKLYISYCKVLGYVFTSSTLESLNQLKELTVERCKAMQVIVKEDRDRTETSKTRLFPRLKSLTLADLPNLKGFFLGMNEFRWPVLAKVKMYGCPQMVNFTTGHSEAQKLNYIYTGIGKHSLECGLDFDSTTATHETQLPVCTTPNIVKLLQFPWSFSNLVEVDANEYDSRLLRSRIVFPCNELLNLKNLEKLYIIGSPYASIEEVFEVVEGTNDDANETQSVVVLPKLKEVTLVGLYELQHLWKSSKSITLNFPNLTKVSIERCDLGHVFTCCMVVSLLQLQELQISNCENIEVIVKEVENFETRATEIVFPSLKTITLHMLPNLNGFCLGKADFVCPSLDTLEIKDCPQITVFTNGQSTTPKLKFIDTTFGLCHTTEDPTSFIKTKQQEGWQF